MEGKEPMKVISTTANTKESVTAQTRSQEENDKKTYVSDSPPPSPSPGKPMLISQSPIYDLQEVYTAIKNTGLETDLPSFLYSSYSKKIPASQIRKQRQKLVENQMKHNTQTTADLQNDFIEQIEQNDQGELRVCQSASALEQSLLEQAFENIREASTLFIINEVIYECMEEKVKMDSSTSSRRSSLLTTGHISQVSIPCQINNSKESKLGHRSQAKYGTSQIKQPTQIARNKSQRNVVLDSGRQGHYQSQREQQTTPLRVQVESKRQFEDETLGDQKEDIAKCQVNLNELKKDSRKQRPRNSNFSSRIGSGLHSQRSTTNFQSVVKSVSEDFLNNFLYIRLSEIALLSKKELELKKQKWSKEDRIMKVDEKQLKIQVNGSAYKNSRQSQNYSPKPELNLEARILSGSTVQPAALGTSKHESQSECKKIDFRINPDIKMLSGLDMSNLDSPSQSPKSKRNSGAMFNSSNKKSLLNREEIKECIHLRKEVPKDIREGIIADTVKELLIQEVINEQLQHKLAKIFRQRTMKKVLAKEAEACLSEVLFDIALAQDTNEIYNRVLEDLLIEEIKQMKVDFLESAIEKERIASLIADSFIDNQIVNNLYTTYNTESLQQEAVVACDKIYGEVVINEIQWRAEVLLKIVTDIHFQNLLLCDIIMSGVKKQAEEIAEESVNEFKHQIKEIQLYFESSVGSNFSNDVLKDVMSPNSTQNQQSKGFLRSAILDVINESLQELCEETDQNNSDDHEEESLEAILVAVPHDYIDLESSMSEQILEEILDVLIFLEAENCLAEEYQKQSKINMKNILAYEILFDLQSTVMEEICVDGVIEILEEEEKDIISKNIIDGCLMGQICNVVSEISIFNNIKEDFEDEKQDKEKKEKLDYCKRIQASPQKSSLLVADHDYLDFEGCSLQSSDNQSLVKEERTSNANQYKRISNTILETADFKPSLQYGEASQRSVDPKKQSVLSDHIQYQKDKQSIISQTSGLKVTFGQDQVRGQYLSQITEHDESQAFITEQKTTEIKERTLEASIEKINQKRTHVPNPYQSQTFMLKNKFTNTDSKSNASQRNLSRIEDSFYTCQDNDRSHNFGGFKSYKNLVNNSLLGTNEAYQDSNQKKKELSQLKKEFNSLLSDEGNQSIDLEGSRLFEKYQNKKEEQSFYIFNLDIFKRNSFQRLKQSFGKPHTKTQSNVEAIQRANLIENAYCEEEQQQDRSNMNESFNSSQVNLSDSDDQNQEEQKNNSFDEFGIQNQ